MSTAVHDDRAGEHETDVSPPFESIRRSALQAFPLYVVALPRLSTAMHRLVETQDTEVRPPFKSIFFGAAQLPL